MSPDREDVVVSHVSEVCVAWNDVVFTCELRS